MNIYKINYTEKFFIINKQLFLFLSFLFFSVLVSAQKKEWTLKECIDFAYTNNIALRQQMLNEDISRINYSQAKSNILPNLNFTDGQGFSFGNTISNGNQISHQNSNTNNPSLVSNVVIYGGNKLKNIVKENKIIYDASKLDYEKQKNDLSLNIMAAYIQIMYQYDAVKIAQGQIANDSIQVDKTKKYVVAGQLAESNLFLINAQLATDKSAKVNAENLLILAKVQLQQLMELPINDSFEIDVPIINEILPDIKTTATEIYKYAEGQFPEIKSAALRTNAAIIDLQVNKASGKPTLSLSGSLSTEYYSSLSHINYNTTYQNQTIGFLQNNPSETVIGSVPLTTTSTQKYPFFNQFKDNFSQLVSINLSVPIFNNYKSSNNIQLAKIAIENAKLNEQAVKNTLRKNIEQAYTDILAASKNYMASAEQLNSETKAYIDMEKKFNAGLASATDYLVEKTNYYKSNIAFVQSKYNLYFKIKVVDFYTGTPLAK